MLPMGGTHANLKVDDAIGDAILGVAPPRFVKVTSVKETLVCNSTVQGSDSFEADFSALPDLLVDKEPCIVIVNCRGVPESSGRMVLLGWTPSGSPVKLRTIGAASKKTLGSMFTSLKFKEWNVTEREEITHTACINNLREMTEAERLDCMSREEYTLEEVKRETERTQESAPAKLAGMAAVKVKTQPSFEESLKIVAAGGDKVAIVSLSGPTQEELSGSITEGISSPADLKDKLPADEPKFVVIPNGDSKLCVVSWQPEGSPLKLKMKLSTFKASALQLIKDCTNSELTTLEVTDPEDLNANLLTSAVASGGVKMPGMGGFKPPVGGFKLPGMK